MNKSYIPELQKNYNDAVIPKFLSDYGYQNVMTIPRLLKITLNMGIGNAARDKKLLEQIIEDLKILSGQQPVICNARKSVASFKIRDGMPIGCKVTLRRKNMYEFLNRLINVAIPRFRDFRGLSKKSFDGMGNYNMGIKEHTVFPEINHERLEISQGMDVSITTSTKNDDEAIKLLECFNFPFKE